MRGLEPVAPSSLAREQCTAKSLQTMMLGMPCVYAIVVLKILSSERRRFLGKVGRVVLARRSMKRSWVWPAAPMRLHLYGYQCFACTPHSFQHRSTQWHDFVYRYRLKRCAWERRVNGCGRPGNSSGWELSSCVHRPRTNRLDDTNRKRSWSVN